MNNKMALGAISVTSLIGVIVLGWFVYVRRINKPAAEAVSLNDNNRILDTPKSVAIESLLPAPTSTKQEMTEGISNSNEEAMNVYWLSRINELRQQKQLEPIAFDARLARTAMVWAVHMGTTRVLSHDRPNGEKVSEWIKAYNLPFKSRQPGGGYGNTFTENIGRAYADTSIKSLEKGLDQVLVSMVDEGPEGDHYRTIFSPDWNRYGGGFYFDPIAKDRVRVYMAFHYASLQ
ncbi:CAP domain-containing protein [Patescibacteria group bacterium]|nr:CAP domain-containing protein [Patescibacteria group bacterium]